MADSTDDLIEISPITIKREHLLVTDGDSIITEFEELDNSSGTGYFLLGENVEKDNTGNDVTEVDHDKADIPSDDPLGDIPNATATLPVCRFEEPLSGEDEYQDEVDEIERIINEGGEDGPEPVIIKCEENNTLDRVTGVEKVLNGSPTIKRINRLPTIEQIKKVKTLKAVKTAICVKCNTGFPSTDLYEHHMSTVHQDERPYPCRFCEKRFQNATNCQKHETIHDPKRYKGLPQFACDLCDKRYHLKGSLASHRLKFHFGYKRKSRPKSAPIIEHHSKGTKNPTPYRAPKRVIPCPHCDLTFGMPCLLRKHMLCHTKEKKFSCPICQQPFPVVWAMKNHIRTVHEQETPSGAAHPTPKWKAKRTYSCTICNKAFTTESQHRYHMRAHSEERSIECKICGNMYKSPADLRHHVSRKHRPDMASNPLKLFKCLICGRDNFLMFTDLTSHRRRLHGHIPYDSEKEKPFVCGICGKPHFNRERAIICAILGHDSTSLRQKMFRHHCPECPPEILGYRNLTLLRSHWKEAHEEIPVPVKLRAGMYSEKEPDMTLPLCTVDRKKAEDIRNNGPPVELLKGKIPLFTERELLPIPKEDWTTRKEGRSKKREGGARRPESVVPLSKHVDCSICGLRITRHSLKRHMSVVHGPSRKTAIYYNCAMCNLRFNKRKTLQAHEKVHRNPLSVPRRRGRPRKNPVATLSSEMIMTKTIVTIKEEPVVIDEEEEEATVPPITISSMFSCRFCDRKFVTVRGVRIHEKLHLKCPSIRNQDLPVEGLRFPIPEKFTREGRCVGGRTVNVNDLKAVRTLLGNKCVRVHLFRLG